MDIVADLVKQIVDTQFDDLPRNVIEVEKKLILDSLGKVCYGFGTVVRQRPELHRAVILLLDKLVERGSHTGFRLRDYIIAPLPTVD